MKAIKIASGVAISALAAAISAQAHAEDDTEFSWTATGSMEAVFISDFDAGTKDVDLDEAKDFDSQKAGEAWGLETTLSIVHGPFSGGFTLTADDSTDVEVSLEDIVITDGAISFGQVGSLVDATPDYASDMDDSEDLDSDDDDPLFAFIGDLDEGADVEAGIRYTMGDLKVQLEGQNDYQVNANTGFGPTSATVTDYGVAASYTGEMDALSYVVEAQFRASDDAVDGADPYIYVGAGVTYSTDMFEVIAGVNRYTVPDFVEGDVTGGEKAAILEYGFEASVTPVEGVSLYVEGRDYDAGDYLASDTLDLLFGASYTFDVYTITGEYTFTTFEELGDEVFVELAYADGPIDAYVSVDLENFDAGTPNAPLFEVGASYTQDNGVVYSADYDFRAEEPEATDLDERNAINTLTLSAAYAF